VESTLDSSIAPWLIATITLLVGIGIGFFAGRWFPGQDGRKTLMAELDAMRKHQQDYEQQVSSHFSKTAQLLGSLTLAYRDFHNHIADGAEDLSRDSNATQIKPLPELPEDLISPKAKISQPLDYSPDRNVLHEEYDLVKEYQAIEPPRY
jgi:uncharacterized membrane-anchored protein YhcB (DUF1043 family)